VEPHLKALGERVAAAQDQRLHAYLDLGRARARLLDAVRPSRRPPLRTLLVAALALLLVLAAGTAAFTLRERPLAFRLGNGDGSDGTSQWIAAPEGAAVPIHFSDGTQLTLLDNARARVVDLDSRGATVVVERGELRASVVPRKNARWRVFVGPFAVRVTGTEFDVGWQPETERFSLNLRAGSVVVTGPGLDGERAVHAGETLRLSPRAGPLATDPEPAATAPEPAESPASASPQVSADALGAQKTRRARELHKRPAQPDFRELASHQLYQEALAAAEAAGFELLCRSAALEDLLLLADTARLAGTAEEARQAYRSVRERFPGRDAGKAAFFLGRLAFDRDADYAQAARYFALSIEEQPQGPLAREAAGRLLETQLLLADSAGARHAARQYLDRYPGGPHAKVAKRVLAQP